MTESPFDDKTHWSEEKEAIKTNKPLKIILFLLKSLPSALVHTICYPIAFFYLIFASHARKFARAYQKQLREFTNGRVPHRISAFRQILKTSAAGMKMYVPMHMRTEGRMLQRSCFPYWIILSALLTPLQPARTKR